MNKTQVNLIYPAHQGKPSVRYDGPEGTVYISKKKNHKINNVALSWYGLKNPTKEDSIFVLEPMCVHPKDYDIQYLKNFKHVFAWADSYFKKTPIKETLIPVNHPNIIGKPNAEELISKWKPWSERKDDVVIVANRKSSTHSSQIYNLRTVLGDFFHTRTGFNMKWYGQSRPNKPYSVGMIKDKISMLNETKFTICSENCYHPDFSHNYFSEKMMHAWMAGCVPIYMGCHNIDELFPKSTYIDLRKYVEKSGKSIKINYNELYKIIKNFTESDYNKMMEEVKSIMRKDNGLFYVSSWDRVCRTMLETFSKKEDS
jgi:hypothetical protein